MIRINLLPEAKRVAATGGSSQVWAVVYLLSVFAWAVVLFLVYLNFKETLDVQLAANGDLERQIEAVKAKSSNIGEVEAALAKSRQLEEVVGKLQTARQGPARVLMELSRILSDGKGPNVTAERLEQLRRDNPLAGYNAGWDIRRLWLLSFTESERECMIRGTGKTNEDIAEFLRRLALSDLFEKITLQSTTATVDPVNSLPAVSFDLSCQVRY